MKTNVVSVKSIVGIWMLTFVVMFVSCIQKKESPLPVFGEREVVNGDTVYHTIQNFQFLQNF